MRHFLRLGFAGRSLGDVGSAGREWEAQRADCGRRGRRPERPVRPGGWEARHCPWFS